MKDTQNSFEDNFEEEIEEQIEHAQEIDLTPDGKAIIDLAVNSPEDFFSPYSLNGDELNSDINNFILEYENDIPINKKLKINVYVKREEADADKIKNAIRTNYANKLATCLLWLKRNLVKSLIFFALGLVLLSLYIVAEYFNLHLALICISEIAAWVFLWEGVYQITIQRTEKRLEAKRLKRLISAEISVRQRTDKINR